MKYLLWSVSIFLIGCQVIDPIVVPIDRAVRDVNSSSTLYEDNTSHTKVGFQHNGLVWEKKF